MLNQLECIKSGKNIHKINNTNLCLIRLLLCNFKLVYPNTTIAAMDVALPCSEIFPLLKI